jgi:hypothetical protein
MVRGDVNPPKNGLDKERKKYVKRKKRSVALSSYSAPKTGV